MFTSPSFLQTLKEYKIRLWRDRAQYALLSEINLVDAKKLVKKGNTIGINSINKLFLESSGEVLDIYNQLYSFVKESEDWLKTSKLYKTEMENSNCIKYNDVMTLLSHNISDSLPKQKAFFTILINDYNEWFNSAKKYSEIIHNYIQTRDLPTISPEELNELNEIYKKSLKLKLYSEDLQLFQVYGKIIIWLYEVMMKVKPGASYSELLNLENEYQQFGQDILPDDKYIYKVRELLNRVSDWVTKAQIIIEVLFFFIIE